MTLSALVSVSDSFRSPSVLAAVRADLEALRRADPSLSESVSSALTFVETFRTAFLGRELDRLLPAYLRLVGSTSSAAREVVDLKRARDAHEELRANYARRASDPSVAPDRQAKASAKLSALTPPSSDQLSAAVGRGYAGVATI